MVFVIFGTLEQEELPSDPSKLGLIIGIVCGILAIGLVLCGVVCVYSQRQRQRKPRRGPYSDSFDVLQYSAFSATNSHSARTDMMNHYHDVHSHTEMRPATSVASRSSGRGSAEYDDERVAFQEEHHYSHGMCHCSTSCLSSLSPVASGLQKTVGYFPRTMPDSGLPDADCGLKVPIPASVANSSNDSIHQFNEEGGREGNYDDVYGRPAYSRDPSSNESSSPHCRDQASV